jgi:hypothetical protein
VNVIKNGTLDLWTALANQPRVVDGDADGVGAAVTPDQNNTLADGDYLEVEIDQVGSGVAGGVLQVILEWKRT